MTPLQVASSGRHGTAPTNRNRTYWNQGGGEGKGIRGKTKNAP